LLEFAPHADAQLLMPLLGQPVESSDVDRIKPWWCEVEHMMIPPAAQTEDVITVSTSASWPFH
jgi:hypothetical protein